MGGVISTFTCCCDRTYESPYRTLYVDLREDQWPIVYSDKYNISFCGLEKCHPFDSQKWGRVFQILQDSGMVDRNTIIEPSEITEQELRVVHTQGYLDSLKWSCKVAYVTEIPFVACICNCILQKVVLKPLRYQTAGSIIAAKLALERGWAINIGGGFHHCHAGNGGGFCVYADITLAIRFMFRDADISKAMIVDLDAHQGNGHERDFLNDDNVYILDVYNGRIYPHDTPAKEAIKRRIELDPFTGDDTYLKIIKTQFEGALNEFRPDLVIYNAGTDILDGDRLGLLSITAEGIVKRDEIVFELARSRNIPIVMMTSGGYQHQTAEVIAQSILNLRDKGLVSCGPLPT